MPAVEAQQHLLVIAIHQAMTDLHLGLIRHHQMSPTTKQFAGAALSVSSDRRDSEGCSKVARVVAADRGGASKAVLKGLAVATCCHHRCCWRHYVGQAAFLGWGFTPEEFEVIKWMTGKPKDQKTFKRPIWKASRVGVKNDPSCTRSGAYVHHVIMHITRGPCGRCGNG